MEKAIYKQITSIPKVIYNSHFYYFADKPLEQIHIDTMFFQPSGNIYVENNKKSLIPILIIVNICSRYIMIFVQKTKNENIKQNIEKFIKTYLKHPHMKIIIILNHI